MTQEQTFTREQLRGAVRRWEEDIRANPDEFMKGDEAREVPIVDLVEQYVDVLFGYMESA